MVVGCKTPGKCVWVSVVATQPPDGVAVHVQSVGLFVDAVGIAPRELCPSGNGFSTPWRLF